MTRRLRIAFVDDEPNILTSLRRSMLAMLDEWEMAFCKSGQDLLDRMQTESFDIVVSDMRMPGMDGAALLRKISELYPETVRVILSGYADRESVFQTIGPAHFYLAKPCDPIALRQAIHSRAKLRDLMTSREVRQLLGGMCSLPSAPDVFLRLVAELNSPQASVGTVAEIIRRDIAMTAELLKVTNSSYFSINARATTPLQAVRVLGLELVQTLALRIGIFRQFRGSPEMEKQIELVNGYSFSLAASAERMAVLGGSPEEVAKATYCAALLSTIGSLVLLQECEPDYRQVLAGLPQEESLSLAEERRFGADHGLLGAYLLSLWGFADPIVEAVAFAARPSRCLNRNNPVLTALHLAIANGPPFPLASGRSAPASPDIDYLRATGWRGPLSPPPDGRPSSPGGTVHG